MSFSVSTRNSSMPRVQHQSHHSCFNPTFYNPLEVRRRRRTSTVQLEALERAFRENTKPGSNARRILAQKLDMTPRGVQTWFQNRRAKAKQQRRKLSVAVTVAASPGTTPTVLLPDDNSCDSFIPTLMASPPQTPQDPNALWSGFPPSPGIDIADPTSATYMLLNKCEGVHDIHMVDTTQSLTWLSMPESGLVQPSYGFQQPETSRRHSHLPTVTSAQQEQHNILPYFYGMIAPATGVPAAKSDSMYISCRRSESDIQPFGIDSSLDDLLDYSSISTISVAGSPVTFDHLITTTPDSFFAMCNML